MRHFALALAFALAACSGSATGSSGSGSSGSSGNGVGAGQAVLGGSLAFTDARAAELAGAPQVVTLHIAPGDACATPSANWLLLQLSADGGAVQPGHYDVASRQVQRAELSLYDDAGNPRGVDEASVGSVDLDAVGPPATGRFDLTFPSGTLQGSFDATACP